MRIRTIKPEWLEDEKLAAASDEARVLSVALILMSDDHGRGRASIATIAAETWRYALERNDGADAPEVLARASRALRELVEVGFVGLYEVKGQRYFEVINWKKHQKVDKPSAPRVPAPEVQETPKKADIREALASHSRGPRETLAPDLDPDLDPDLLSRGATEDDPPDLEAQISQLLAHGPETPASTWRLLELLTTLESGPDPDRRVHLGWASTADLGRMGKILERARRDAPGLETTPMRMVAVEWSSLLALVAAGHIAPPKAPAPYFQKLFGQLSSKHQEAAE